ncbi:MAG: hypothetical protein BM565_04165 [Gammaproteobacteria bacterium MedPE]|nr:MAG: hypothetical protein BM565_04165 [Gammaproteobacteria bacterium MedPE]
MMSDYQITTEEVYGGFDLVIKGVEHQVTLFIQDKTQATMIGEQIIHIAQQQNIDINSAAAIFNQGMGMFATDNMQD